MNNTAHFKRRKKQYTLGQIISTLIIIAMIIVLIVLVKNYITNKNKTDYASSEVVNQVENNVLEQATLKAEADITQSVLEVKATKAKRFVDEINNEIEYITLTETGNYTISHSRLNEDAGFWRKTFKKSNIQVDFNYQAIFSIKTSDIFTYESDGKVYIQYDTNNIAVKSVETSQPTTKTKKDWFGKKYNNQEVLSLVEIAKDEIYDQLNNDSDLKSQSADNLNTYFTDIADKIGLDELVINNEEVIDKGYNFVDNGMIAYNHGEDQLENIAYIVIHSTSVKNVDALQFYDNLNSCTQSRESNAHFFIDDKNVIQFLPTNIQSWSVGCKNPKINATNCNTLNIEICEFDNVDRQQKAIENCVTFTKEVLLKQYPDVEIIMHRSITSTQCPSILTDSQFQEYFKGE